ncbi:MULTISPECIES: MFS transporter [unclassified Gemella]|uniref:MFS transporter n=1 Tax=unclassified Gemella TaxID=2624949 RepID=UPI001D1679CE|nr:MULTISPECIES: MFS transporter [unclassified Gemella]
MSIKILISFFMIFFILGIVIYLTKKYKLSKDQILIFSVLVLFWSILSIIRAYRKLYAITPIEQGGLSLSAELAAQIAAAYGLISFLFRLPMFFMSDLFKKRRIFVQLALFMLVISSVAVFYNASYTTLYFSSLALGLGATMLAMFNVIFSETFSKDRAVISVSILSAAPLLAEFIAAPIQYLFTFGEYKYYNYMWLLAGIMAMIALLLSFQMKDYVEKNKSFSFEKVKVVLKHKSFLYLCLLALLLSFIKFSTSGANMLAYGKTELNMNAAMLAYMDTVFAVPQLISGILVGTYFSRKLGIQKTLLLLFSTSILFFVIVLHIDNPYIIYFSYLLNGFFYGGVYNILISMAMQYFDREYRSVSMGIYQAFFAVGIYYGDYVYVWISRHVKSGLLGFEQSKSIFLITLILTVISMILVKIKIKDN